MSVSFVGYARKENTMSQKIFRWFVSLFFALVLSLTGFTPALAAPPANDNFSNAESINSLPFSTMVDNTDATAEPGEPQDCSALGRSVWYSFAPTEAMVLRVDMSGSPVSGVVGLYLASGSAISDLTSLGCVFSGTSFNLQVEIGNIYYLRVDSFAQAGNLQVNLTKILPPANDNFASADVISSLPFNASVDNMDATKEPGEGSNCFFLNRTVWYSFTPSTEMTIQLDTKGSAVGGVASLYVASGPAISDLTFLTCAVNGSAINTHVEAGKTYYVQLDGDAGQTGALQFNLKQVSPPGNDNFANAEAISALPFSTIADTTNATLESDETQLSVCSFPKGTVWYSFTPAENITARVDMVGSSGSGSIDIYLSSGPAISDLTSLACAFTSSSANIQFEAGKTYYLRVDGDFGQAGILQINLTQIFPPANDSFGSAEAIPSLPFSVTVDNTDASLEFGEPPGCGFQFRSLWYSWTPAENAQIRMNTLGSTASGNVTIYLASGSSISDLTFLTCAGGGSSTKVQVEAGKTYYLRVDSYGQAGPIQVNLVQSAPPANDNIASAQAITSLPLNATVDISDATNETDEPQFCVSMPNTAWYSFTATEAKKFRIDTQGSFVSANVNVYHATGPGFADLQFVQCSGLGGTASFIAEASGTYIFQVGGVGQDGTAQFNLTPMAAISGRVTDAGTGAPLPGNTEPFAAAQLFRICGDGCLEFVNSQNADGEGRFVFDSYYYGSPLPAGSYQITATAFPYQTQQFGPFDFSGSDLDVGDLPLNPPSVIHGRVVASDTGSPLQDASVMLVRCNDSGCLEYVNSQNTDSAGQFQINSFSYGAALPGGTYELEISATLYETRRVGVTISDGENRDLGDLSMTPVPLIGSINGRLIDAASGKPIETAFRPELDLYRCEGGGCSLISLLLPDAEGRFHFETDFSGIRLAAGSYKITAFAEQYDFAQTDIFEVGENTDYNLGDIKLKSIPVRFSEVQPCADIPASGGDCIFTVKISNGTDKNLTGKTWSLVYSSLPNSFAGYTNFQIKDPQAVDLGVGKSKMFRFRFTVPTNPGPYGSSICPRIFVGQGSQALFNTVGFSNLFCIFRNASGFTIASLGEVLSSSPESGSVAATATESEPNNSCQTAQDVGALSGPFVMDGNLDSLPTPDIDFFRFSTTPGSIIAVDQEGQPTGKGTLENPLLGLFDSNCNFITLNDDSSNLNSHLDITVPDDGVFIIAATTYPDFGFSGGGFGSYQLTVTPPQFINSITGVITDTLNGKFLRGDAAPFAFVRLLRCETFGCFDVNSQNSGSDGSFHFETDSNGSPLRVGDYMIIASADQYQMTETEMFNVGEGEDHNTGLIALNSYPIRFSDTQVCNVPAQGGGCDFSVKVTNGLPTKFSGKVWSIIDADNLRSFINFSSFQADSPQDITLGSGKSTIVRFRFMVRGSVPNGASICATVFAGKNPGPFFNAAGQRFLFCIVKGDTGFTLMSEQEMQSQLQHIPLLEIAPNPAPSLPKK
jgi:hypothetical protein